MTIQNEIKSLTAKITGLEPESVDTKTIAKTIRFLSENYPAASGGSITETDPTVPDWAKQPEKPTYTAAEVGALPADTAMPSGDQLLTGSKTESVAALAGDADLPTVVQAVNGILAALQARGVTK